MSETKADLERIYTIPLSRAWIAPRHQRTKRAVNILKEYAQKHMKSSEIKIDSTLNERLWDRGITSPPRRITVKMTKDEDGVVTVSLPKVKKATEQVDKTVAEPSEQSVATDAPVESKSPSPSETKSSPVAPAEVSKEEPKSSRGRKKSKPD